VKNLIDKINPKNQLKVDLNLLPENPIKLKINANKQLLILALANLLTNASKYSNNKIVTISIASSEQNVVIIIKDQGVGIPEEEMPYI
jgi:signal transduction histidine kinase